MTLETTIARIHRRREHEAMSMARANLAAQARMTAEDRQADMDWLAFEAVLDARGKPVPQNWRQLRWRHVWPVALALIPLLSAVALGMAATPFR